MAWSIYLVSLVLCTVTYRISPFHPLAKYPGPLACKVSKIWFAFVAWQGKQHLYYNQLHRRYGDIVRIGTPFVILAFSLLATSVQVQMSYRFVHLM